MRILFAALHPPGGKLPIGGVQTWITTIAEIFKSHQHNIEIWGPEWSLPKDTFDIGIFASWVHTKAAGHLCKRILRISHGIIPTEREADAFTSEEVRDFWKANGPIIRQPIDINFWKPDECEREYFTRFSYRGGLSFLPSIADKHHLKFIHLKSESPEKCRFILQRSAIVIATGRAALEAMACGAPVVIADAREYQGEWLDFDTTGSMARNYSGRGGLRPSSNLMDEAICNAMQRGNIRQHVIHNHDANKIAEQLLDIVNKVSS